MSPTRGCVRMLCMLAFACVLSLGAVQIALAQSDAEQSPDSSSANPVVNVGHFAPFGTNAAGTSVTVRVNGTDVLTDFVYPNVVKSINVLPAGTYTVEVLPTGTATVAISGVVTLENNKQYTLLAIGDGTNQPLALAALEDNPGAPPAGHCQCAHRPLRPLCQYAAGDCGGHLQRRHGCAGTWPDKCALWRGFAVDPDSGRHLRSEHRSSGHQLRHHCLGH